MTFRTNRLVLRPWTLDDVPAAFKIYGDEEVTRHLRGPVASEEAMREQLESILERCRGWEPRGMGAWAITLQGEVIGQTLLKPLPLSEGAEPDPAGDEIEVGWSLRRDQWGHGLATEAASALLTYGFDELSLSVIYAVTNVENHASRRVCARLGMTDLGTTERYYDRVVQKFEIRRPASSS